MKDRFWFQEVVVVVMFAILVTCLAFLGGCASAGASPSSGGASLRAFTLADAKAALADAQAHDDTVAASCWTHLAALLEAAPAEEAKPVGALSALQRARDLRRATQDTGARDALALACGPLVLDTEAVLTRLGILAGVH